MIFGIFLAATVLGYLLLCSKVGDALSRDWDIELRDKEEPLLPIGGRR